MIIHFKGPQVKNSSVTAFMSLKIVFHCPNFEKVEGRIASGLSIHPSVHHAYLKPLAKIVHLKIFSLFLNQNIRCGYSKERSQ